MSPLRFRDFLFFRVTSEKSPAKGFKIIPSARYLVREIAEKTAFRGTDRIERRSSFFLYLEFPFPESKIFIFWAPQISVVYL